MTRPFFRMRNRISNQGVTLIELLISMVISLIVIIALSGVYITAKQSIKFQDTTGRMQEDAAYALEVISRDVRMAGYAGCRGVEANVDPVSGVTTYFPGSMVLSSVTNDKASLNPLASLSSLSSDASVTVQPLTPHNFLRGFDTLDTGLLPASVTTDTRSHALYFSHVAVNSVVLNTTMTNSTDTLAIGTDTYSWGTTARFYVISDCYKSHIFLGQVSGSTPSLVLTHDMTAGNFSDAFTPTAVYSPGAMIAPLEWRYYYIAARSGAGTGAPMSLYRKRHNGLVALGAEEIIANVEGLRIHYGENTAFRLPLPTPPEAPVPTYNADVWRTSAANVTDWSRVVAIRVGLMMTNPEGDGSFEADAVPSAPTLLGQSYTLPTGASPTRVRKEFSTTIVLRNRVPTRY
jgi:type IV pilus assembly protein PilW